MLAAAWHTAWLHRVDARQFPSLADLIDDNAGGGGGGQTPEQLLHAVKMWKAALGHASAEKGEKP